MSPLLVFLMKVSKYMTRFAFLLICAFGIGCAAYESETSEQSAAHSSFGIYEASYDQKPMTLEQKPVEHFEPPAVSNAICAKAKAKVAKPYRLGPQDVLNIGVFAESDLSGPYTLDNTGSIVMPLIGEVMLSGCTLRHAEVILREKFMAGYLVNPSISIEVSKYRPFFIMGEVRAPGSYEYVSGITALEAVALAGGFTYRANRRNVNVLQKAKTERNGHESRSIDDEIYPGEVIVVKERFF